MKRRRLTLLVSAVALVLGSAAPSAQALGKFPFQALLNPDGSGRIFMNNGTIPSWESCRPDLTACTPFAVGNFNTGDAPPETVFWAGGEVMTPIWKGNLRETAPPSVQGRIRGNEVVIPVAGQWAGGWATDYNSLSLSICKTVTGEHCLEIDYESVRKDCGTEEAKLIDPAFAGRFLRVVDRRYGSGSVFAGVGHPAYYSIPKIQPEATVSTAVVGKIAPATAPPSIDCGPPPLIEASIAANGSAKVACHLFGCEAILIARHGRKSAQVKRKLRGSPLSWGEGSSHTKGLRLTPTAIDRLEGGPLKITVKVNGRIVARRTVVRLGAPR